VALNKYPIIIRCKTEAELRVLLSSEDTTNYVKNLIKNKRAYDSAVWMIRSIYKDGNVYELFWEVPGINYIDNSHFNIANSEDLLKGE
jgi:hypothetical protein